MKAEKEKIEKKKEEIVEEVISETPIKEKKESDEEVLVKDDSKDRREKKKAEAVVNIYTSFNNTLVHVTDMSGKTIAKVTGGMVTKHGRLKANPTIAMFIS